MSETASTAGTGSASPSTSTSAGVAQTSGASQTANAGAQGQAQGQANPGQAPATPQERLLAEQDLDAFVEHTINGKKEKIKLRDALKGYGMEKTAQQRMQEAAAKAKRAEQLQHLMQTDFAKYCEITGQDPNQFLRTQLQSRKDLAEEILAKEYELQQMDPHQRKAMELENENKTLKERMMAEKTPIIEAIKTLLGDATPRGLENASVQELQQFYAARNQEFQQGIDSIHNELLGEWEKGGLPREKDFGIWMAQVMLDHQKRAAEHKKKTGEVLPPLQPGDAAARVKARFLRSSQALYDQMDGKSIVSAIGEKAAEKVRAHLIELASQNGPGFNTQENRQANTASSESKPQFNSIMEYRKWAGI